MFGLDEDGSIYPTHHQGVQVKVAHIIRRDAGFIAMMLIVGFVAGAIYSSLSVWRGGIAGFSIAFICATIDLIVFPHFFRFTRLSFQALLFFKTITYTAVAIFVVFLSYLATGSATSLVTDPMHLLRAILLTLVISFLANLFLTIRRVLGKHVFGWLLCGRYRRPVEEIRMFMFVDLTSSTTLAEQIGHVKYHQLIHKFWCDIADVIINSQGDIYKYVGDEVIITWPLVEAKLDNCWLECFFGIKDSIRQRADQYMKEFGSVPQFRASLHCGMVVAGEMGDWKSEVGFIGDTINTTARILDACETNKRNFIVSDAVRQRTADIERYTFEVIPEASLRGRQGKVTLYSVDKKIDIIHN